MVNKQRNVKFPHLKDVILLDIVSTLKVNIINPKLITNIRTTMNPLVIATNAETKRLTLEVTMKRLFHAWSNPTQVDNIFGLSHLKENTQNYL